jgi:hypothetical protein
LGCEFEKSVHVSLIVGRRDADAFDMRPAPILSKNMGRDKASSQVNLIAVDAIDLDMEQYAAA